MVKFFDATGSKSPETQFVKTSLLRLRFGELAPIGNLFDGELDGYLSDGSLSDGEQHQNGEDEIQVNNPAVSNPAVTIAPSVPSTPLSYIQLRNQQKQQFDNGRVPDDFEVSFLKTKEVARIDGLYWCPWQGCLHQGFEKKFGKPLLTHASKCSIYMPHFIPFEFNILDHDSLLESLESLYSDDN